MKTFGSQNHKKLILDPFWQNFIIFAFLRSKTQKTHFCAQNERNREISIFCVLAVRTDSLTHSLTDTQRTESSVAPPFSRLWNEARGRGSAPPHSNKWNHFAKPSARSRAASGSSQRVFRSPGVGAVMSRTPRVPRRYK